MIKHWYEAGLRDAPGVHKNLPSVGDWPGTFDIEFDQSRPLVEIVTPYEHVEAIEDELWDMWTLYANNDYDVIKPLSNNSANRTCGVCSDPADYYLLKRGVSSWFAYADCAGLSN